jgi:hypothetical protein
VPRQQTEHQQHSDGVEEEYGAASLAVESSSVSANHEHFSQTEVDVESGQSPPLEFSVVDETESSCRGPMTRSVAKNLKQMQIKDVYTSTPVSFKRGVK